MSGKVVGWAFEQAELSSSEKFVLVALADNADRSGVCWPSQKELAAKTGLTPRTVRTHIQTLEGRGLLTREPRLKLEGRGRASDAYRLAGGDQPENDGRPTGKHAQDQPENDGRPTGNPDPASNRGTVNEPSGNHNVAPEVRRLCQLMADLQNQRAGQEEGERLYEVTPRWEDDMRKLIELDKRPIAQVEQAIEWIHKHPFESTVVLSPGKLRARYVDLRTKARGEAKRRRPDRDAQRRERTERRLRGESV